MATFTDASTAPTGIMYDEPGVLYDDPRYTYDGLPSWTDSTASSSTFTDATGTLTSSIDSDIIVYEDSNINVFDVGSIVLNDVVPHSQLPAGGFADSSGQSNSFTDL